MKLLRITAEGLPLFKENWIYLFMHSRGSLKNKRIFCIHYFQIFI